MSSYLPTFEKNDPDREYKIIGMWTMEDGTQGFTLKDSLPTYLPEGNWVRIPGHRQYVINEAGLIYRTVNAKNARPLKQSFHPVKGKDFPNGYWYVTLMTKDLVLPDGTITDVKDGISKALHILMCTAFHGPKPSPIHEVNHLDGVKINNAPYNLAWCTPSENIKHSYDVLNREVKSGPEHWLYGNKASDDTKKLMSEAKQGSRHPKFKGYYITPAGRFESSYAAAAPNNTHSKNVYRKCLKGEGEWRFERI